MTFRLLVSFAVVALVTSILGMMAAKCVNRAYCAVIFGVFSFIVMIVFILMGAFVTTYSAANADQIRKFCAGGYDASSETIMYFHQLAIDIDSKYDQLNKKMCTQDLCPCPYDKRSPWTQTVTGWTEEQIQEKYGRSYSINSPDYLYFSQLAGETTYDNFLDCMEATGTASLTETNEKIVKWLEKTYSCSGLCEKALFYVT